MITRYELSGLTCGNCINKVSTVFTEMNGIDTAEVTLSEVKIESSIDIGLKDLQAQLHQLGDKYQISHLEETTLLESTSEKSWIETYKPVLLIFVYILGTTLLIETLLGSFDLMRWMRHFMAGFFLVFSFFKLLNLKGFVESYQMYDIVAKKFPTWGYIYVFLELALGVAF